MKTIHYFLTGLLLLTGFTSTSQTNTITPDFALEAQTILDKGASNIRYYYYPNLQAYFDTETSTFIYSKNGQWIEAAQIPSGYRGYSASNGKRVAITDYSGDEPYEMLAQHKKQFPSNYSTKRQPPVKTTETQSILAYN